MRWTTSSRNRRRAACLSLIAFLLLTALCMSSGDASAESERVKVGAYIYEGDAARIYMDRQLLHKLKEKQDTKVTFSDAMSIDEARVFQYEFYAMHPEVTLSYAPLFALQTYDNDKKICAGYVATYISSEGGAQRYRNLEDAAKKLLRGTSDLSDKDKVRIIAKRLRSSCEYADTPTDLWSESLYGCLADGKATCIGYSEGFFYLMRRAGVPCKIEVNRYHAWNKVFYDRKWHKTDLTRD